MPLSRRARFNWWIVVGIAALAAPLWMLIGGATTEMRITAAIQSSIALAAMVWLLATTPRNAIRLPVWVNLIVIWLGVFWLLFASGAAAYLFGEGAKIGMLMFPIITLASDFWATKRPAAHGSYSSWYWAPYLWHPLLWAAPWPRFEDANTGKTLDAILIFLPFTVWALLSTGWKKPALFVFVASVAMMFALTRWS